MKNNKILHEKAAAKIESIERGFDNLFKEARVDCAGNECNKVWDEKYKERYEAMDRMLDKAYRAYWYTDETICRHNKQVNHRATIAPMRAAGLHRMTL